MSVDISDFGPADGLMSLCARAFACILFSVRAEQRNSSTQNEVTRVSKANEKMEEEIVELSDSQ